mmetsp:Transcript_23934/g.57056  ORF Transcript_23934/g.57056 Transcript_23934/m.57056 type:complete len:267 (+) Transcript_23934:1356-2156(+)
MSSQAGNIGPGPGGRRSMPRSQPVRPPPRCSRVKIGPGSSLRRPGGGEGLRRDEALRCAAGERRWCRSLSRARSREESLPRSLSLARSRSLSCRSRSRRSGLPRVWLWLRLRLEEPFRSLELSLDDSGAESFLASLLLPFSPGREPCSPDGGSALRSSESGALFESAVACTASSSVPGWCSSRLSPLSMTRLLVVAGTPLASAPSPGAFQAFQDISRWEPLGPPELSSLLLRSFPSSPCPSGDATAPAPCSCSELNCLELSAVLAS